jgi:hypothetical protein
VSTGCDKLAALQLETARGGETYRWQDSKANSDSCYKSDSSWHLCSSAACMRRPPCSDVLRLLLLLLLLLLVGGLACCSGQVLCLAGGSGGAAHLLC